MVDLAIAVAIVQAGDLIAAEHMDHAIDHLQPQQLVQACGNPSPAEVGERAVNAFHPPDIALHCADDQRTIGEGVVAAAVEDGVPGVVVGQGERVDGEGGGGAEHALRVDHLRPLRRAAFGQGFEGMLLKRRSLPDKRAIHHRGHIEIPHAIKAVEKANLAAMPAEALVADVGGGCGRGGMLHPCALGDQATEKARPHIGEADEPIPPDHRIAQRVGIEADRKPAFELHADRPRDRDPKRMQHARLQRA